MRMTAVFVARKLPLNNWVIASTWGASDFAVPLVKGSANQSSPEEGAASEVGRLDLYYAVATAVVVIVVPANAALVAWVTQPLTGGVVRRHQVEMEHVAAAEAARARLADFVTKVNRSVVGLSEEVHFQET